MVGFSLLNGFGWSLLGCELVLPLDFHGRLRVTTTMFIPGALHGIEASFLAGASVRKLRTAVCQVVWSSRRPLASAGAVLSLLDGPTGCDPEEVPRVHWMIGSDAEGCPGHGPAHLLVESAADVGLHWGLDVLGWERPGLPVLGNLAGPIQHACLVWLSFWFCCCVVGWELPLR